MPLYPEIDGNRIAAEIRNGTKEHGRDVSAFAEVTVKIKTIATFSLVGVAMSLAARVGGSSRYPAESPTG